MAKTKNLGDVIRKWLRDDPELASRVETESINAHIARQIYEYRQAAGLTQEALARLVGTQQPAIARMEDANYEGHSIPVLKRIADSLGCNLRVEFYEKPEYRITHDLSLVTAVEGEKTVISGPADQQQFVSIISAVNVTLNMGQAAK